MEWHCAQPLGLWANQQPEGVVLVSRLEVAIVNSRHNACKHQGISVTRMWAFIQLRSCLVNKGLLSVSVSLLMYVSFVCINDQWFQSEVYIHYGAELKTISNWVDLYTAKPFSESRNSVSLFPTVLLLAPPKRLLIHRRLLPIFFMGSDLIGMAKKLAM